MTNAINLDWTKLLGFDQAGERQTASETSAIADPRVAQLGAKVGGKSGDKPRGDIRPDVEA